MKHLNCKLYYKELHLKYLCKLPNYWLQAVWGWHDSVETCSSVIICEIIVCICWSEYKIIKYARYIVLKYMKIADCIFWVIVPWWFGQYFWSFGGTCTDWGDCLGPLLAALQQRVQTFTLKAAEFEIMNPEPLQYAAVSTNRDSWDNEPRALTVCCCKYRQGQLR